MWIYAPDLFLLTVGIAFALHWVVFSWSIGHPAGFVHLALRAILVPAAWLLGPDKRMGAAAAVMAFSYAFSVRQLNRIDWLASRVALAGRAELAVRVRPGEESRQYRLSRAAAVERSDVGVVRRWSGTWEAFEAGLPAARTG